MTFVAIISKTKTVRAKMTSIGESVTHGLVIFIPLATITYCWITVQKIGFFSAILQYGVTCMYNRLC